MSYSAGAAKIRLIRTFAASAVQNPEFNTPKIAKRLVRNNHAKKCCIFSLKCLDVNNLIHNFVTQDRLHLGKTYLCPQSQDRLHLGKAYKQACKLCSRFALSLPQNSNRKTANKLHLRRCENLLKHQTMKSFAHITPCTLCPSAKPVFACVEGTRFTPPSSVNELTFTFNSASPSCIRVRRRIMS